MDRSRRTNCATAFTAARSRPRSCWQDIRTPCGKMRSRIFPPPGSRWRRNIAGSARTGRRPLPGRAPSLVPGGAIGDATMASAENGEKLLDHGAAAFCELLADVDAFDLNAL